VTPTKRSTASSPRRRKSSPRSASPRRQSLPRSPVELDEFESSTALSEVSLVVEVTSTPARRRSGRASTDLGSDALVPGGSPSAGGDDDVEMPGPLETCTGDRATADRGVVDEALTEPPHRRGSTPSVADSALSLLLDENLRDVMSLGFADGGSDHRGWMSTAGITTADCLGGVVLGGTQLGGGGEMSEDASSDIDVELRRIVANVAHNHNNDDVNSMTSDDCSAGVGVEVDVARYSSPPALLPGVGVGHRTVGDPSSTPDQLLAVLDSQLASAGATPIGTATGCAAGDCPGGHVTSSSAAGNGIATATLCSDGAASGPPVSQCAPVSASTSNSARCCATDTETQPEVTSQEEPSCQQAPTCGVNQSASCSDADAATGCCQKPMPSTIAPTGFESCGATGDISGCSSELGQRNPVFGSKSPEPVNRPITVHESCGDVAAQAESSKSESATVALFSVTCSGPSSSDDNCRLSTVEASSFSSCVGSVRPHTSAAVQSRAVSTSNGTSTSLSPRSSRSSEVSPTKGDQSVNCVKTSAKDVVSDVGSSEPAERASVATQTSTDFHGRYFRRVNKPLSSALFGSRPSRAGPKDRFASRIASKSAAAASSPSASGSSAYHFGAATTTTSPGSTVLLSSGTHMAPVIMPAIGPLGGVNGKTTFLITVPANFSLPASVGAVLGPAAVSVGVTKAASTAPGSGCQLVARTGGTGIGRLTEAVSSTALVLGQTPIGSPFQLLVAAATALTSSASTSGLGLTSQSPSSKAGVVATVIAPMSVPVTVQTSNCFRRDTTISASISSSMLSHAVTSSGVQHGPQTVTTSEQGPSVRVAVPSCAPTTVPARPCSSSPTTAVAMLPRSPTVSVPAGSSSSPVAVWTTTTTVPRCSPSASPTSSGARHATIASLPRVSVRRRSTATSDVVAQPNGPHRTPPAVAQAPSAARYDGGKSPVSGTTTAKQPVVGEGAPVSIIRAILERNLSCPLSYNIDEALTGRRSSSESNGTLNGGIHESCSDATHTVSAAVALNSLSLNSSTSSRSPPSTEDRHAHSGLDPVAVGRSTPSRVAVHFHRGNDAVDDRQGTSTDGKKRSATSTYNAFAAKHRRFDNQSTPEPNGHSVRSVSGSGATDSGNRSSTVASTAVSTHCLLGTSGGLQTGSGSTTGSGSNATTTIAWQQNEVASASMVSESGQADKTSTTLARIALPKKVYAYLGSAGAARENAAAAAAAMGDRPLHSASSPAVVLQNSAGARRAGADDGPIRHLRMMCSGLAAASAGGID